jgi:thymidylate kinase
MLIAFLGVDGSGKSTVIDNFLHHINDEWAEIEYVHFRPDYILKNNSSDGPVTNPHAGKSRGLLMSIIKLLYFAVEYNYAFYVHYRKPGQLVVFDRYYYDVLADPERTKVCAPRWVINLVTRLIPVPDLVFYLYASVDVLYERKREIGRQDLEKILKMYSKLVEPFNFHKISSENKIEITLDQVFSIYRKSRTGSG